MGRRSEIDQEVFDIHYLQKTMRSLFPKKNDFASKKELAEVVEKLKDFSIITKLQVRLFLKKHRRQLLEIDQQPLEAIHQEIYREINGNTEYLDSIRRRYWFAYPALIRTAMNIEFGDDYEDYSHKRDDLEP